MHLLSRNVQRFFQEKLMTLILIERSISEISTVKLYRCVMKINLLNVVISFSVNFENFWMKKQIKCLGILQYDFTVKF